MSFKRIENKILSGKRITPEDALILFQSDNIFSLGRLASHVSRLKNGNNVYFIRNRHINPTNICINRCTFCAFSRSKGEKGAYELTIRDIIKKLRKYNTDHRTCLPDRQAQKTENRRLKRITHSTPRILESSNPSFSEVHIVGGLHPDWPFEFYLAILEKIRKTFPLLHIKAFTAVEIDYFSRISGLSLAKTLAALKRAGLGSMPGGGAEIFSPRVRKKICPEKINGNRWLRIMETAHRLGIRSNATMLFGHVETYEQRVEHMRRLRDLQDKTGGFQAFIPLAFHPMNTRVDDAQYTSGIDDLRTVAVSRIFLDNFSHIKAYWIMLGEKIAQLALLFGADDLDGTIIEEKITRSAGALSGSAMTETELVRLIRAAGKNPVERDSFYNPVHDEQK